MITRLARQAELALAEVELSLPQYRLLTFLELQGRMASKLADDLAVSRPSVTALADGLVARGLVERRSSLLDRRRVEHVLTDAGRGLLAEADARLDRRLEAIASYLDGRDGQVALDGLTSWKEALDAHRAARLRPVKEPT